MLDALELEPEGPADDEAQLTPALAPLLEEAAEADRVEPLTVAVQQRNESALGNPPRHLLILANLHQFEACMPGQKLLIMLDIVGERRPQPAHGDDDDAHDGILRGLWKIPIRPSAT